MEIKQVKELLTKNFKAQAEGATHLYEVNLDKDQLWALFLDSFPPGTNEIYRERREFDCSSCRQFIKNIGNVGFLKNNVFTTIWDFETNDTTFQPVLNALSAFVKSQMISDVYVSKLSKIGTDRNFEPLENGTITEWHHLFLELPSKFVDRSSKSEAEIKGELRSTRNVFKRSLDEITEESVLTVLELISQNSLHKGAEWKGALNEFLKFKNQYDQLQTETEKQNYTWEQSVKVGGVIGRIRNHSIGTLLVNLSEGMDLETAVGKYEKIVAGENYKRSKPIHTQKMRDEARKTFEKEGYLDSLPRQHAVLDDITVNNILFSNKDAAKRIAGANIFDQMSSSAPVDRKKFSRVEEITIENFIKNVLPFVQEAEVLVENQHIDKFVSLIGPQNKNSKSMFKWNNGFSWAYAGNMTDSAMKANVKAAGGNVEGVLRFSIQWNDNKYDGNDLDAHCKEPGGDEIYYGNKTSRYTGGQLDVDIINPVEGKPAVENITWATTSRMKKGVYEFSVHNYTHRGGRNGFTAEIEFDGQIHSFEYKNELRNKEKVVVAEVTFDGENFSIKEKLPSNVSSREVWNLQTNQFVPVTVIMHSPNYWDEQEGIGHKHYFFMLKDCINPESPNGFYNEFLKEELYRKHKRVCETLGSMMAVKTVDDQLSGIGFSSTKRGEVIVKVKGQTERVLKVKF